jgi:hypothetical protein
VTGAAATTTNDEMTRYRDRALVKQRVGVAVRANGQARVLYVVVHTW